MGLMEILNQLLQFAEAIGEPVPEVGHEHLTQSEDPLLPPHVTG
jgi:hypothetical protein